MKSLKISVHPLNKLISIFILLFILSPWTIFISVAQDEAEAKINLRFEIIDEGNTCTATVTANDIPVKDVDVHFYVQRMYSLLPIGKYVTTDENGQAAISFPNDIPGDKNGNIIVVSKIEDDDTYGDVEFKSEVKWGVLLKAEEHEWNKRSLSAARDKAPMILIIVSNAIIALIWGTIVYVMYQIVRIRKASKMLQTKKK